MGILWTVIIGFVAGIIAKLIHPGPNEGNVPIDVELGEQALPALSR